MRKRIKAIGVQRLYLTDALSVLTTHLSLRRRDRIAQLDAIYAATADCPCTVIAGGFNEWSAYNGLEELAKRFDMHFPGRTFFARSSVTGLDRFALSRGLQGLDAGFACEAGVGLSCDLG